MTGGWIPGSKLEPEPPPPLTEEKNELHSAGSGGKPRAVLEPLPSCGPGEAREPPTKTFVGGVSTLDLSVLDSCLPPVRVTTTSTTAPSDDLPNPLPTAKPSKHLPATEGQNDNNGPIFSMGIQEWNSKSSPEYSRVSLLPPSGPNEVKEPPTKTFVGGPRTWDWLR